MKDFLREVGQRLQKEMAKHRPETNAEKVAVLVHSIVLQAKLVPEDSALAIQLQQGNRAFSYKSGSATIKFKVAAGPPTCAVCFSSSNKPDMLYSVPFDYATLSFDNLEEEQTKQFVRKLYEQIEFVKPKPSQSIFAQPFVQPAPSILIPGLQGVGLVQPGSGSNLVGPGHPIFTGGMGNNTFIRYNPSNPFDYRGTNIGQGTAGFARVFPEYGGIDFGGDDQPPGVDEFGFPARRKQVRTPGWQGLLNPKNSGLDPFNFDPSRLG